MQWPSQTAHQLFLINRTHIYQKGSRHIELIAQNEKNKTNTTSKERSEKMYLKVTRAFRAIKLTNQKGRAECDTFTAFSIQLTETS